MSANLDYSEGYSARGTNDLVEEIQSIVMKQAGTAALFNLKMIDDVCDQYWEGEAKEKFLSNLKQDAKLFSERITKLCEALNTELQNTAQNYKNFDRNLIQ